MKKSITSTYACLNCRKSFKKDRFTQNSNGSWQPIQYDVVCPQCSGTVYDAGPAFKAPKMSNIKEWKKLEPLFKNGYKFFSNFGNPFIKKEPEKVKKQIMHNKFSKFTSFAVLTARDAFSTRPLQRR